MLQRISGADAPALTQAMSTHTKQLSYNPQSRTDAAPAKASNNAVIADLNGNEKQETEEELNTRLRGLMNQSEVVLFMKGSPDTPRCGFSRKISTLLKEQNVEFSSFDILTDETVRQGECVVLWNSP